MSTTSRSGFAAAAARMVTTARQTAPAPAPTTYTIVLKPGAKIQNRETGEWATLGNSITARRATVTKFNSYNFSGSGRKWVVDYSDCLSVTKNAPEGDEVA